MKPSFTFIHTEEAAPYTPTEAATMVRLLMANVEPNKSRKASARQDQTIIRKGVPSAPR